MKLFFGRINVNQEPRDQFSKAYYKAGRDSGYFDELSKIDDFKKEPVYAFMLADKKVALWKARNWQPNGTGLEFDVVIPEITGMNGAWLAAIKQFVLRKDLIVFTIKRPYKKAFFQIDFDSKLKEADILNPAFYDGDNFRRIIVSKSKPTQISEDLLIFNSGGKWNLATSKNVDNALPKGFIDNSPYLGRGRKKKDGTISKVVNAANNQIFEAEELPIWSLYDAFFCDYNPIDQSEFVDIEENDLEDEIISSDNLSLNRILYGPPGTGKTYNTINTAVSIVDPEYYEENYLYDDRVALQKRYNELLIKDWDNSDGQIAFCTFHQSFSYEDFVEGIKPLKPHQDDKFIKYDVVDGLFKKICRLAEANLNADRLAKDNLVSLSKKEFDEAKFYKISLGDSNVSGERDIYDFCAANNLIAMGYGEDIDFSGMNESEIEATVKEKNLKPYTSIAINYFKNILKTGDYVIVSFGNSYIRALGKVTGEYALNPNSEIQYSQFRAVEWIFKDVEIPASEFYEKKLSQQSIYRLNNEFIKQSFFVHDSSNQALKRKSRNFVLIIDEINRGNVSSIFGELITLIETSKRSSHLEAIEVVLPYSKERFSVPPNVYIVGTMNTADRSVEALDSALRRRFSFLHMAPDESKLKKIIEGIDLAELLRTLNDRLKILKDADHTIGHAWLMDVKNFDDLTQAFGEKILPLLGEYFFNDFEKLGLVLGEGFFSESKLANPSSFASFKGSSIASEYYQSRLYELKPSNSLTIADFERLLNRKETVHILSDVESN